MKIEWHVTLTGDSAGRLTDPEPLWAAMRAYASKVTRPDTDVDLRFLGQTASAMVYPLVSLVNGSIIAEDIRACAAEGADAVLIAAAGEPGLDEARSAVDVPVVGSMEAALALSQFIGRRVGIVTINDGYGALILRNVARYGLTERLMVPHPVRHFDMSWDSVAKALAGDPDEIVSGFTASAESLLRDGADVVLGAAQIFGALLDAARSPALDVPVVDCAAAGLKMAESLVDLSRSVGLKSSDAPQSIFRRVPDAEIDAAFRALKGGR